ncbi:hypothetical protein Tco_1407905 [Tanacetum coccineum]
MGVRIFEMEEGGEKGIFRVVGGWERKKKKEKERVYDVVVFGYFGERRGNHQLTPNVPKTKPLHVGTVHWNSWGDEGHLRSRGNNLRSGVSSGGKEQQVSSRGKEQPVSSEGKEQQVSSGGKEQPVSSGGKDQPVFPRDKVRANSLLRR